MFATIRVVTLVLTCAICAVGVASFGHAAHPGIRELLLATPDCAPPCFLDIHPGETFYPDAIRSLQAHPWVSEVIVSPELRNTGTGYVVADYPRARVCSIN